MPRVCIQPLAARLGLDRVGVGGPTCTFSDWRIKRWETNVGSG
jgi:hypothetical protein